ncbi:MAG: hypothetical protein PHN69_04445 [Candidatus Pacebacteria bacterium]|nr:hypothetical protein [Fermentimonas sp.]MDD4804403.1 hypothetical protein [Candidatus Paceibacterota bacterium]
MTRFRIFMITKFGEKRTVDYVEASEIGQLNTNVVLLEDYGRVTYVVPSNCGVQEEIAGETDKS